MTRRPKPRSLSAYDLDRELPDRPPVYSRLDDDLVNAIHVTWLPTLEPHLALILDAIIWGQRPLREVAVMLAEAGHSRRVLHPQEVSRLRDEALRKLRPLVAEWAYATKNADLIRRHQIAEKRGAWVT